MSYFPEKILLATDGSQDAVLALSAAVDLASRAGAELHAVHAWQALPEYNHPGDAMVLGEEEAQNTLNEQVDLIEAAGGTTAAAHLVRGRPAEAVADLAAKLGADLLLIGSRGLGPVERLVIGSTSEGVVDLASCPVLVARGGAWPPHRVVVADDSSAGSERAGKLASGIGSIFGAETLLLRAYPVVLPVDEAANRSEAPGTLPQNIRLGHEVELGLRARRLEDDLGLRPRVRVVSDDAARAILEVAEEGRGPTLVAVGRHGLGRLDRLRLGSVSTKVMRAARGPVLIAPS